MDRDEQGRSGLQALLRGVGFGRDDTSDPVRARDQLVNKFFAVVLLDVDTPTPGEGSSS